MNVGGNDFSIKQSDSTASVKSWSWSAILISLAHSLWKTLLTFIIACLTSSSKQSLRANGSIWNIITFTLDCKNLDENMCTKHLHDNQETNVKQAHLLWSSSIGKRLHRWVDSQQYTTTMHYLNYMTKAMTTLNYFIPPQLRLLLSQLLYEYEHMINIFLNNEKVT
jgi:hypothetical protein